jgi:GTP cyclohydrolase I
MNEVRVQDLVRQLLIEIGEDPEREGLQKTPERVAKSYAFLTKAIAQIRQRRLIMPFFQSEANNMICSRH